MSRDDQGRPVTLPRPMHVATEWAWRLVVIGVAVYLAVKIVALFIVLVAPVLIAVMLVALVRPLTDVLDRTRLSRGVSALVTVVVVLAVIGGLGTLVGTQIASGFPQLQDQAAQGLGEVRRWLNGPPLHITTNELSHYLDQARQSIGASRSHLVSGALAATTTAEHVLAGIFIALFSTFFFLAQGELIWSWALKLLPRRAHDPFDLAARRGWVTLTSFVRATVVVAAVDAIGIGAGAAILGVPLAVPLGVLVFLSAFVPVVGALVSGVVAVLIALVAVGFVKAVLMLAVVLAVQQIEAHVLQPFLMGRAVSVHPLAVILGIAAGAQVAGIIGAFFAVPLIATANTMVLSLAGRSDEDERLQEARGSGPGDEEVEKGSTRDPVDDASEPPG